MLYPILNRAHSGLRWVVLLLLLAAIVWAFQAWKGGRSGASKLPLYALISVHVQLLLGLVLYFLPSPYVRFEAGIMKDSLLRFYTVEHISMMLIAIILITAGYSRAKKAVSSAAKGKTTFIFYLIGLALILASIPWPFRSGLNGSWY
jgi:hypothetical protein